MSVKRFIPDFKYQTGNAQVTLFVSSYPDDVLHLAHLLDPLQ